MADTPILPASAALDTMEASGGYICFRHHGQGAELFLRYNPETNQFERLTVYEKQRYIGEEEHVTEGAVKDYTEYTYPQLHTHLESVLDNASGGESFGYFYEPVAYPDTPFVDIEESPQPVESDTTGPESK